MEWKTLLSTEKLASEIAEPAVFKDYPINEFEKDYSKIVSSAAFNTPNILKLELSAQVILAFLLDKFVHAVLYDDYQDKDRGFVPSKADKKFLAIFSDNYKQDYANAKTGEESFDLYLRLLMVTDYISGMTDSYARTLYRELSGIE